MGGARDSMSRNMLEGEALYGVFPVLNALLQGRRAAHALYVLSGMDLSKRKDSRAVRQALSAAQEAGVGIQKVSRHALNTLSGDKLHQGLVLDCSPLAFTPLDRLPPAEEVMAAAAAAGTAPPVWVALDEVLDPQNFGAILRSSWCLGAAGLLVSSKNCAPLSAAVSKASAGAMESAEVHASKMLHTTLQDAVASGWLVLGAAGDAGAQSCQDVRVDRPAILVLGNEGRGLRTNIRRTCTGLVRVDMGLKGQGFTGLGGSSLSGSSSSSSGGSAGIARGSGGVDSLNVSVATGILLHSLTASAARHQTLV